jgi:hypothetical protein
MPTMTYVVARADNTPSGKSGGKARGRPGGGARTRYEIRESLSTPAGPRARTLATFRVLTSGVIAEAASRARRPFDAAKVRARAAALGAPQRSNDAAASATTLVAQLRNGEPLPPALVSELHRALPPVPAHVPDTLESAVEWIGVDDATRGRTLFDLLDLASHLPSRPRPPASSFPRLSSNRHA